MSSLRGGDADGLLREKAAGGPRTTRPLGEKTGYLDLMRRGFDWALPPPATPDWAKRGYAHLFNETILQADEGCDFDFMRGEGKG